MTAIENLPTLASVRPQLGRLNPLMRSLQQQGPICQVRTHTGDEAWLVTRYAELKELLLDRRLGQTHPDPANRSRYMDNPMLDMLATTEADPEIARDKHRQMRSALNPHFSARRMAGLRPRIAARVRDLLDVVIDLGPPLDIHANMSLPLSFQVLCDLLEIPDRGTYQSLLREAGQIADPNRKAGRPELFAHLTELAADKREHPDEGLISSLCESGITDENVAALTVMISISYQVTPNNISAGIALFALNPDQRHLLTEDPDLMSQAIEEVLRMGKVGESFVPRYASEDIEIGGVTIRRGDLVLCDHYTAGFDERVFGEPERFDITRSPNPHLAFSRGITHCIGAPLARLEMTEVFTGLFTRLPALRLTAAENEIYALTRQLGVGITELPVTWS